MLGLSVLARCTRMQRGAQQLSRQPGMLCAPTRFNAAESCSRWSRSSFSQSSRLLLISRLLDGRVVFAWAGARACAECMRACMQNACVRACKMGAATAARTWAAAAAAPATHWMDASSACLPASSWSNCVL